MNKVVRCLHARSLNWRTRPLPLLQLHLPSESEHSLQQSQRPINRHFVQVPIHRLTHHVQPQTRRALCNCVINRGIFSNINTTIRGRGVQTDSTSESRSSDSDNISTRPRELLKGNVIDGKAIAEEITQEIKDQIDELVKLHPKKRRPHLSVVLVGNDPASVVYVRNKYRTATTAGMTCDILRLPHTVTQEEVQGELNLLNRDTTVDGVLVQLPLPKGISERFICDSVLPEKDVDGFSVLNVGRFCVNERAFIPATPLGVLEILKRLKIDTVGKNAVVCGRSKHVGLPIALHLQASRNGDNHAGNATTTICHRHTPPDKLRMHTQNADILITATGIPGLITPEMVKDEAVVIDIGITRVKDDKGKYRLVGDVDFEGVKAKASLITPVPGGVGPVTVAMVLKNTLTAYKKEIDFYQTAAHRVSTSRQFF